MEITETERHIRSRAITENQTCRMNEYWSCRNKSAYDKKILTIIKKTTAENKEEGKKQTRNRTYQTRKDIVIERKQI